MRSTFWRLFQALNIYRRHYLMNHPIYQRDRLHGAAHRFNTNFWSNWAIIFTIILSVAGVMLTAQHPNLVWLIMTPCLMGGGFIALIATMPMWVLPLSVTLGTVIVRERQRGTWDLLRVTPLNDEMLLLAKLRAALQILKPLLDLLVLMLLGIAAVVAVGFTAAIVVELETASYGREEEAIFWLALSTILFGLGTWLFLIDRAQQLLCMALAAVAAGATRSSVRSASTAAALGALLVWLAESTLGTALIMLGGTASRGYFTESVLLTVFIGPIPGVLLQLPILRALAGIVFMIAVREAAIRALWRGVLAAVRW
jgi:hypothetical protein